MFFWRDEAECEREGGKSSAEPTAEQTSCRSNLTDEKRTGTSSYKHPAARSAELWRRQKSETTCFPVRSKQSHLTSTSVSLHCDEGDHLDINTPSHHSECRERFIMFQYEVRAAVCQQNQDVRLNPLTSRSVLTHNPQRWKTCHANINKAEREQAADSERCILWTGGSVLRLWWTRVRTPGPVETKQTELNWCSGPWWWWPGIHSLFLSSPLSLFAVRPASFSLWHQNLKGQSVFL